MLRFVMYSQMSYLVLLVLYSYFMTVELSPAGPSVCEVLVWVWALTLWFEEIRQVVCDHYTVMLKIRQFCKYESNV